MTPLLLALVSVAWSAETDVGGTVESHLRIAIDECTPSALGDCTFLDFRDLAVVGGWFMTEPTPRVSARGAMDLRLHQGTSASLLEDTTDPNTVLATSLRIQDAWVELRDFVHPSADLKLGVQTFRWGVAEGVHVVDVVNPWDLENPLALDARLPVPAIGLTLHRAQLRGELVLVPFSWPAALPVDGLELIPEGNDLLDDATFEGVDVGKIEARVSPADTTLANLSAGTRLSWAGPRADLGLVLWHGRDSLPQANGEMLLTGFQTDTSRVDIALPLSYPRVELVGFEARAELPLAMTGWLEIAAVLPELTTVSTSRSQLEALERLETIDEVPDPIPEISTQDGAPLVKWVTGLDRSFGRFVINAQWMHGFPTERQSDELRDYLLVGVRTSLTDTLVLLVRSISDFRGILVMGDLMLLHGDAAEITLGAAWAGGPPESSLSAFRGASHVGTGVTLLF